jgi:RecB family exonuclease
VLDAPELRLRRSLALARAGQRPPGGHPLAPAVALRKARRDSRASAFDGIVQADDLQLIDPQRPLSPTSLQRYATCGFQYFCASVLGLRETEEPEERTTLDAATRGSIVHHVLQRFFTEARDVLRADPGRPWDDTARARLAAILDEELAAASSRGETGLPIYLVAAAAELRADLDRVLTLDSEFRARTGAIPAEFEKRIDVVVTGRRFRGAMDRVDYSADGSEAWVTDYKTGKAEELDAGNPFGDGKRLQLGIYAAAEAVPGRTVHARYWYITRRGGFAEALYEHTPENAALLGEVVTAMSGGIEAGAFIAVPAEDNEYFGRPENCVFCAFDRICPKRRVAVAEARADDPQRAPWERVAIVARGGDDV